MFSVFSCSSTEALITFEPATEQQRRFSSARTRGIVEPSVMAIARLLVHSDAASAAVIVLHTSSFNTSFHASKQRVLVNLSR